MDFEQYRILNELDLFTYVKNNQSEMGYFVGVLMHVIWNAIAFAPLLL
jgi:hypothetical protein